MRTMLQHRKQLAQILGAGIGLLIIMTLIFVDRWGVVPVVQSSSAPVSTFTDLSLLTVQVSPTATPTLFPISSPTIVNRMTVTPPRMGQVITLTTTAGAIGWASDLDGRSHFNMPNIHAGIYQGFTYYGLIRFDLSMIPPGSTIDFAALELVGLDDRYLGKGGAWDLNILGPDIEPHWPEVDFATLATAPPAASLPLDMDSNKLAPSTSNHFIFDAKARAALEERLAQKSLTLRLDGPQDSDDNLFSWDSGYHHRAESSQPVILTLVINLPPIALEILASSPTYVVVTSTPTPENIITAAAMAAEGTQSAEQRGTATSTPAYWVTPIVITPSPTPANPATALFREQEATAQAFLFGPATPTPFNIWTATPSPTAVTPVNVGFIPITTPTPSPTPSATPAYRSVEGEVATPWIPPSPTPRATPIAIPPELVGKIAFLSNRSGGPEPLEAPLVYLINPDGSGLAVLTGRAIYEAAITRDRFSSDQRFRAFVKDALRFDDKRVPALYFYDYHYGVEEQITHFGAGAAWDPVWSPTTEQIAFVSNDSQDDEIWIVHRDGNQIKRLTGTNEQYNAREIGKDSFKAQLDGHPSWSPDGSQLVFWSNRGGSRQIWVMNADGSNAYSLSTTGHDDWDPVWIKYTDPPRTP